MKVKPTAAKAALLTLLLVAAAGCVRPPIVAEPSENPMSSRSEILAADGTLLATLFVENREPVKVADLPKSLTDAVIAAEDQRFWSHKGVDLKAIARAGIRNTAAGETLQGGSTITQQYVKNVYYAAERPRTFKQKVIEAELAFRVEQRYSKREILERYLNTVYFGDGAYGVQAAAEEFFRKSASDLTVAESAMIAGSIRSPETDNPRRAPQRSLLRRNHVLGRMTALKMISEAESNQAAQLPLGVLEPPPRDIREPYFVEYVRQSILSDPSLGRDEAERANLLYRRGLRIVTSLDMRMQNIAHQVVAETLNRGGDPSAALVSIDPRTGQVKAMVGGADFNKSQVNLAIGTKGGGSGRQPGSAFKTFVLATAIDDGILPHRTYSSNPPAYRLPGGGVWRPQNSEGRGYGMISIEDATIHSVNAVFARLGMDLGPARVARTAHRMGITSHLGAHPSLSLGSEEVSVLEMASAYGTLANYGFYNSPTPIARIEIAGEDPIEPHRTMRHALDPGAAWLVTNVLTKVIESGTGERAQIGRVAAGKTGTSQNNADAWFVGYTPDLVTAVWVGYPSGRVPMTNVHGIRVYGGTFPAMIWSRFMSRALAGSPPLAFDMPTSDLVFLEIDPVSGLLAAPWCPGQVVQILRQLAPTETCPAPAPPAVESSPMPAASPEEVAPSPTTTGPPASPNPQPQAEGEAGGEPAPVPTETPAE